MASFHFACPYCSGPFAVDDPPADQPVVCPHCGGAMALPAELPPPVDATIVAGEAVEAPPMEVAPADVELILPFDVHEPVGPSQRSAGLSHQPSTPAVEVRRLSREEKERRRMWRNLVMMVVGVCLLTIAAVVLSRL